MRQSLLSVLSAVTGGCVGVLQAQPAGQWDFDSGDLSATLGQPMTYANPTVTPAGTSFGTTTALGISDIGGTPANVMGFQEFGLGEGYYMPTPGANGGGSLVNIWTLILDVLYPASSDGRWRAIIDIDEAVLAADAEFFVNTANGIGISGNYTGQILPDTWYRVAITMDSTTGEMRKYINGSEVGIQDLGDVAEGRWAMSANYRAELFADNDGDVAPGFVNSIQLRDTVLSAGEIFVLGGPSADGIPVTLPQVPAYIESRSPAPDEVNVSPKPTIDILLNSGDTVIVNGSVELYLDEAEVAASVTPDGSNYTIRYPVPDLLPQNSKHTLALVHEDNLNGVQTNSWVFTVAYKSIVLPAPIAFEDFETITEGSLPTGWVETNYSAPGTPGGDLAEINSDSYLGWTVSNQQFLEAAFGPNEWAGTTYDLILLDPGFTGQDQYQMQVYVVNGEVLASGDDLIDNRILVALSGWRSGHQVQYVETADYDVSGQDNVFLAFQSLYLQNQDSLGAVEYSIDGGATWLPALYMIDEPDVARAPAGDVDAVTTLTREHPDVPAPDGSFPGTYGSHLGVADNLTEELAPFISPRLNDDWNESKRVELLRLAQADNQPRVRFRFTQVGTDSWYFMIDNLGLYSIDQALPPEITGISVDQGNSTITWAADPQTQLQTTTDLSGAAWSDVPGTLGQGSHSAAVGAGNAYFRLSKSP